MKIKQFFKQLTKWYSTPIEGTNIVCKFYAQATSFNFELHDSTKTCFTAQSLVHRSGVYVFYLDKNKQERQDIINNIINTARDSSLWTIS